ncbi:MAG: NAD(P)H-dependent glycerol-3-phosphate dehydrogenase [Deltaproteobacteria bacterium]|nr:MAG: NAD(P)H-dependent glycerol-3-phosphate dehydrogenase [Deltaproteobacteria bacterium]
MLRGLPRGAGDRTEGEPALHPGSEPSLLLPQQARTLSVGGDGVSTTVGVIGAGSFGTIIAGLLLRNGESVLVWGRDATILSELSRKGTNRRYLPDYELPGRPEVTTSAAELSQRCDLLFCVLPAKAVRAFMADFGDHARTDQILVSCTKGLEYEGLVRMTEVIEAETPVRKVGALSGPNLAKEIARGTPSAAVIASSFDEVIEEVRGVLNSDRFRLLGCYDPVGVEFCGAIKNIYAIASGAAHGLGYGLNAAAFLLTRALREMAGFAERFGARPETFSGLAGTGDLIATAMSPLSRNFRFGRFIAEGKTSGEALEAVGQTVEGYHTVEAVYRFLQRHEIRMPIVEAVHAVVHREVPIGEAVAALLSIDARFESEIYR